MKIAVSACLMGDNVRYDGSNKRNKELIRLLESHEIVRICPEAMVFAIPHPPIELQHERVIDSAGYDHTEELEAACKECLKKIEGCDLVILKSRSPSCGLSEIYDGSFSGTLIKGNGLFAALCLSNGYPVYTENDLKIIKDVLDRSL